MLVASAAVTALAPKLRQYSFLVFIIVVSAVCLPVGNSVLLQTDRGSVARLEVVSSPADLEKGLSGRSSLATQSGMLFELPFASDACFWMKGMQVPLDIVWVNDQHKVTHIVANLSPASYPDSYCAPVATSHVVELNAGVVARAGITVGDTIRW